MEGWRLLAPRRGGTRRSSTRSRGTTSVTPKTAKVCPELTAWRCAPSWKSRQSWEADVTPHLGPCDRARPLPRLARRRASPTRHADQNRKRTSALQQGIYTTVPLDMVIASKKRVDVTALYDAESYRPKVRDMLGKPMFLY